LTPGPAADIFRHVRHGAAAGEVGKWWVLRTFAKVLPEMYNLND